MYNRKERLLLTLNFRYESLLAEYTKSGGNHESTKNYLKDSSRLIFWVNSIDEAIIENIALDKYEFLNAYNYYDGNSICHCISVCKRCPDINYIYSEVRIAIASSDECINIDSNTIIIKPGKNKKLDYDKFLNQVETELKITELEKDILRYIKDVEKYKYIARDKNGQLTLYTEKPVKDHVSNSWVSTRRFLSFNLLKLFKFIKWEDDEPYPIEDLIKE